MRVRFKKNKRSAAEPGTGDCVIRSFALHQGWSYDYAKTLMECFEDDPAHDGVAVDKIQLAAPSMGLAEVRFTPQVPVVIVAERFQDAIIYIEEPDSHVTTAVNGCIVDTWDSRTFQDKDGYKMLMMAKIAWVSMYPTYRRKTCRSK